MRTHKFTTLQLPLSLFFVLTHLLLTPMTNGAETNNPPANAELEAKKREADLAEAELRIQTALKSIAVAKKDADAASNAEVQAAEQQKNKALAEQSAAEAAKATFMAGLPASSTKPLDGKVELDDKAGYFTEILAFESAGDGADQIAKQIVTNLGSAKKIYLVRQPDYLRGAFQLKEIEQRLDTIDKIFDALNTRYTVVDGNIVVKEVAPLLALAAVPAIVGALGDVAALFRTDRSVKGRVTTVNDEALMAQVARALQVTKVNDQLREIEIFRPSLNTSAPSSILAKIGTTRARADKATLRLIEIRELLATKGITIEDRTSQIAEARKKIEKIGADTDAERKDAKDEIKRLNLLIETVGTEKPAERTRLNGAIAAQKADLVRLQTELTSKQAALVADVEKLNGDLDVPKNQKVIGELAVSQLEGVIKAFNDLTTKLISVPDGGTASPLSSLAETCLLRDLSDDSLILSVAVAGQGGEVEGRRSIWTGSSIFHRAGTACTYILFAKDGRIASSGLVVSNRQAKEGKRINR